MKREKMVCVNCICVRKWENSFGVVCSTKCLLNPEPRPFHPPFGLPVNLDGTTPNTPPIPPNAILADPTFHYCGQGRWHEWSDKYNEWEPYNWGEWDDDERPQG